LLRRIELEKSVVEIARAGREQNLGGEAAIGRVPVVGANGEPLMPCKPAKAKKLLETGKAVKKKSNDRIFLQLKFNPSSSIAHPPVSNMNKAKANTQANEGSRNSEDKVEVEFNSRFLSKIRWKAQRSRVWLKALDVTERGILTLAPKCVDVIKSPHMIDVLAKIIVKLKQALMSPLERFRREVAWPLAARISQIAVKWGNKSAAEWAKDKNYVKWLAVNKFNEITIFSIS